MTPQDPPSRRRDGLTWIADKAVGASGRLFDVTRRVDGGGFHLTSDPRQPDSVEVFPYCGTPPSVGRACLDAFGGPGDRAGSTFVDLGCGKGRMLALAAEAGFARCVGVEVDAYLSSVAKENLVSCRLRGGRRLVDVASVLNVDARDYRFAPGPLAIYLNNPFGVSILEPVLSNLQSSLVEDPRPATVVLMRRRTEDAANDSPTAELLDATDFLSGGPARIDGPLRQFLLRGFAVWRFATTGVPPPGVDC